jgi:Tol biopolymer transport system component
VRNLDTLEARQLPGTHDAWSPFWSFDSRQIAFSVDRTLKKIDLSGGPPQTLAESTAIAGMGAWSPQGVIVFGTRGAGPLYRIPASGGIPAALTKVDPSQGEGAQSFPQFLPDGRRFLYFRQSTNPEVQGIYAGSLDLRPEQQSTARIVATTLGNFYVAREPGGERLLFLRNGTLMSQPFDMNALRMTGEPTPVVEQVGGSGSFGFFSASATGVLAYRSGSASFANAGQLTWFDRQGRSVGTVGEPRAYSTVPGSIALSTDGSRAAATISPTLSPDLWLVEFARGITTRFTFHIAPDQSPVWSPDGGRLAFRSNRQGTLDVYVKDVNGTSEEAALFSGPGPEGPTDWSRDARFLLLQTGGAKTRSDIAALSLSGPKAVATTLLESPFDESQARLSPDGRWMAYVSNESGQDEIYLRPFSVDAAGTPSVGARWLVSNSGAAPGGARWRGDGRELFYRHISGAMMAVDVTVDGAAIRTGLPRRLFTLPSGAVTWDVALDGQRFLAVVPVDATTSDPITVVLNWPAAANR